MDDIRGGGQGKQLNLIQAPASNAMAGQHGTTEKLLSSLTTHIQAIQTTLTRLTSKLDENTSMVNDLRDSTLTFKTEINEKLDSYMNNNRILTEELSDVTSRVSSLEIELSNLKGDKSHHNTESRELNIIIRGIPEEKDEKMYEVMMGFFATTGCSYPYALTNGAHRLGRRPEGVRNSTKYSRPIKLKLLTRQQKSELFGLRLNYTKHKRYEHVKMSNDLDEKEMFRYREARQILSAAKN